MEDHNNNIHKLTDQLFRHESGKLIAALTKVFGTHNLQLVEDVMQETFVAALQNWRIKGVPDNPAAWLFRAAKNKSIDIIRKNRHSSTIDFSDNENSALFKSEYTLAPLMNSILTQEAMQDDLLKMMFACCHEDLAIESQIALILKTLCGFSTAEIAKAFLTSEDTISKRLYRTKEFFRERKIIPSFPMRNALKERTDAVLRSIYLIFNEGYNSTNSDQLIRRDLLDQAMYLTRLLCNNKLTQSAEVYAVMAIMCFHAARIESRISIEGEIVLLEQQERSIWDQQLINEGNEYMNRSAIGDTISPYHLEGAIAYEHCIAASFDETNWAQILSYYDIMMKLYPAPVAALNRLIVYFKIYGARKTLVELNRSNYSREWERYYLYHSLLGEIYSKTDKAAAKKSFEKAISLTKSDFEQRLLKNKISAL